MPSGFFYFIYLFIELLVHFKKLQTYNVFIVSAHYLLITKVGPHARILYKLEEY